MNKEKTANEAIKFRRSVRVFSDEDLDSEKVENCLRNATLAPNSSNLQLWQFIHVANKNVLKKLSKACLNQSAAKTANQLVIIVVRKDLWRERANWNADIILKQSKENQISNKRLNQVSGNILKYFEISRNSWNY